MRAPPLVYTLVIISITLVQRAAPSERALVLRNLTIIDGTGAPPLPSRTLVIKAGRVVEIAEPWRVPELAAGTEDLDLSGYFAMPGLVDTHVHVSLLTNDPTGALRSAFRGGVTSVRDMGGEDGVVERLAERAGRDDLAEPRVYFARAVRGTLSLGDASDRSSRLAHRPAFPLWLREAVETPSDVESFIARARHSGATGIKLYSDLPLDLLRRLSAQARREGLRVWGHARIFPQRPGDAIAAGVEVLSHASQLAFEGRTGFDNGDVYRLASPNATAVTALLHSMRDRGVILEPTLYASFAAAGVGRPDGASLQNVPALAWAAKVTRRAHELRVMLAAGTDRLTDRGQVRVANIHTELELLVRHAGLTPLEAIRAATWTAARVLGHEDKLGTIAKGKWADLVILRSDPSRDIRHTRTVALVVKRGVVHRLSDLVH